MKNTKRSVSKVWNAAKMMLGALTFSVCMCIFSFESLAAEGTVKPSSAKIRSEANTSSTALASVKSGDELTIKAKTTGADGYVWYQVFVDADTLGFIRSDLVEADGTVPELQASTSQANTSNSSDNSQTATQPAQTSTAEVEQMTNQSAIVVGGDVNVRAGVSTSSSKVTTAKNGTAITVTGKATGSDGKVWYQVNFINNGTEVTGFIRSDYVELGEIIEETPAVEEETAMETETAQEPVQSQSKEYDTVLETKEDGTQVWYLYDYGSGLKYSIPDLMAVTQNNTEADGVIEKQVKQQKIVIIVLVVLVVILVLGVTLLFFKLHDGELDDEEDDDEQFEEMLTRKRKEERTTAQQTRRPATPNDRPRRRPVQEGAAARPKQVTRPVRTAEGEPVRRPVGQTTGRPSNPAARQSQGTGTASQKPAVAKTRTAAPKMPEREVSYEEEPKLDVKKQNGQWHSKNFLTDDDEFEFEFLNMDDPNRL